VPFASSFAKLEIAKEGFDLNESFTLGANSNGINPVTENVTLLRKNPYRARFSGSA
jgi:hypothetical protein